MSGTYGSLSVLDRERPMVLLWRCVFVTFPVARGGVDGDSLKQRVCVVNAGSICLKPLVNNMQSSPALNLSGETHQFVYFLCVNLSLGTNVVPCLLSQIGARSGRVIVRLWSCACHGSRLTGGVSCNNYSAKIYPPIVGSPGTQHHPKRINKTGGVSSFINAVESSRPRHEYRHFSVDPRPKRVESDGREAFVSQNSWLFQFGLP